MDSLTDTYAYVPNRLGKDVPVPGNSIPDRSGMLFPNGREYWILRSNGFGRRLFVLFLNLVDGSKDLFLIAVDSISQNNERKGFGYML